METPNDPMPEQEDVLEEDVEELDADGPKADLGKRFLAYFIDALIAGLASVLVGLLSSTLGGLISAAYFLVRDGLEFDFMDRRSIGKQIMKLRPVKLDGSPMDLEASMRRNWMFALGGLASGFAFGLGWILSVAGAIIFFYEVYKVFSEPDGRRWGDEIAGTRVIDEST